MADLIDRNKALAETWREPRYTDPLNVLTEIRERIRSLPAAQKWIPCSERMPDNTDEVLTTYIVNGNPRKRYVETASYYADDGCGYWLSPVEVIAWMPLPEPWKGET